MDFIENYTPNSKKIMSLHKDCFPTDAEAQLVKRLSIAGDVVISIAALEDEEVVAHVLFSKMKAPFKAIGLAPISVADQYRRRGIAEKIINLGLEIATKKGWQGVFVLGDLDYYSRFGFSSELADGFTCPYQGPYLMALPLTGSTLPSTIGIVEYAPAFSEM